MSGWKRDNSFPLTQSRTKAPQESFERTHMLHFSPSTTSDATNNIQGITLRTDQLSQPMMNHADETDKDASPVVLSEEESLLSGRRGKKTPRGSDASHLTDLVSYRDYSRVPPEKHEGASSLIAQGTTAKEPTFPTKLHMILSNPEFQDIISWLPHGRSWRILQQKAFEERVIPLYFRHGRYSSFARQVNGWGFRRITHGSDYNSYYHEMFLRGMPHLCEKMRRLTTKDIGKRKKLDDEPTPDFYSLSRENPLPETAPVSSSAPRGIAAGPRPNGAPSSGLAEVELALLERRRADLLDRINLLASSNALRQDAVAASLGRQEGNGLQNNLGQFLGGGASNLAGNNNQGIGSMQNSMQNNAAALNAMGNNQALQRQLMAAGRMPNGMPNGNVPPLSNNNMAQLLAMNNAAGFAGMQGLMGNPFGL